MSAAQRRSSVSLGHRGEERDVDHDVARLVEGTDEVLPLGQVDGGFAADRRIDLGDERRRDMDDRDPAQERGGEESGRVAKSAAADRDERLAS